MDRRRFISAISALGAAVVTPNVPDWLGGRTAIGLADIARVRAIADQVRGIDYAQGGGVARMTAMAELAVVERWPDVARDWLRPKLCDAIGELAHDTGFAHFDAGDYDGARQCWATAMICANQADNWALWAQTVCSLARQETWVGNPELGLQLVQGVIEQERRLPATAVALAHGVHSRVLANLGLVGETLAAIGSADNAMDLSDPANDPAFLRPYSRATHFGNTGHALVDLVVVGGHHDLAKLAGVRVKAEMTETTSTRSLTFDNITACTLVMAAGDPEQAVVLGDAALAGMATLDSYRAKLMMWRLRDVAARHENRPDVENLRRTIEQAA